jgi:threonyl-tRNA synthetase (EC 6.1.1.3)/Ser-tRNA(Thr) hydrolase (EC 3.1.1.-)
MSEIAVVLPDGSELGVPEGATLEDVAYEIGPGLGDDTVAGKIEGELVDKATPISDGDRVEIVTDQSDEYLSVLRHSAAHVFAQALLRLYDDATLTIGPWTEEGFYYDITGVDLDEEDLREIEDEMEEIVEADYDIERVSLRPRGRHRQVRGRQRVQTRYSGGRSRRRRADILLRAGRIRGSLQGAARRVDRRDRRVQTPQHLLVVLARRRG